MSQGYPADWDQRRRTVYAEDSYQCQNCGRRGGPHGNTELHAHHIVPKSRGGTHAKSNLVTVCKDCHAAIHGNSTAPTQQTKELEKWTETTGEMIDKSKHLVMDVDEHIGQVQDYTSQTSYEDGYSLIDRNPADNEQFWEEKEDLRRRFYGVKSMAAEREQYTNNVTPVSVKKAISDYIDSFEDYVKATIDIWSFFEEVSEEGIFAELRCPSCNQEVEKDSQFCRHCGADLDFTDLDQDEEVEKLERKWDQLHKEFNEALDKMQIDMVEMDIEMNTASPDDIAVSWSYCPNCGFENSVWLDNSREATCRFCQAQWVKNGVIFTKWEMIDGDYEGDCVKNSEWEKRGRSKNQDRRYEELLKIDQ